MTRNMWNDQILLNCHGSRDARPLLEYEAHFAKMIQEVKTHLPILSYHSLSSLSRNYLN